MTKLITLLSLFTTMIALGQSKPPSHQIWSTLLKKHVSTNGIVNYKGFISDSTQLFRYLKILSENKPDEKLWSADEQKAYWINAYNAFTIKLIINYYPVKSINDIARKLQIPTASSVWDVKFIKIGKDIYDLNEIEHIQLRKKFGDGRFHFALVCASKSCPILLNEAYTSEKLEAQLNAQAKVFLKDKSRNEISAVKSKLSKIFDWYAMDFNSKGVTIIEFINMYSAVKITINTRITYLDYSWELNE